MNEQRNKNITSLIKKGDVGLEIGPSYNPILKKADGWSVEIVDHADAETLREKYRSWNVNVSEIEDVDYVLGPEGLLATINKPNHYDFIIASHVIEHVPDFISFLQECETLLKDNGIICLAVPDKRYCFDIVKPVSTTGQMYDAYVQKRKRHSPGVVFDAHALHTTRNGQINFLDDGSLNGLAFAHDVPMATSITKQFENSTEYLDVHAWHFCKDSFMSNIDDLNEMNLINLGIAEAYDSDNLEFIVILRKQKHTARLKDRMESIINTVCSESASRGLLSEKVAKPKVKNSFDYHSKYKFCFDGVCPICEQESQFVSDSDWFRDHLACVKCGSIPRERAVMKVLNDLRPNWRELRIHESSPSERGTSLKLRTECENYIDSQYEPDIGLGKYHPKKGFLCQDLGRQTFADDMFDVVVTQDVFEHLPEPDLAIKEISRTLAAGGVHVASVPLVRKWENTRVRAKLVNGDLVHELEPEYHGNPVGDGRALVFNDWGYDIAARIQRISGMNTVIYHINDPSSGIVAEFIEIVVSEV